MLLCNIQFRGKMKWKYELKMRKKNDFKISKKKLFIYM